MSDNIITITDFMDPNLDVYARLTENQLLNRFASLLLPTRQSLDGMIVPLSESTSCVSLFSTSVFRKRSVRDAMFCFTILCLSW